jgi:hypothetical protein
MAILQLDFTSKAAHKFCLVPLENVEVDNAVRLRRNGRSICGVEGWQCTTKRLARADMVFFICICVVTPNLKFDNYPHRHTVVKSGCIEEISFNQSPPIAEQRATT